jgi:hypothetical protein
VGVSQLWEALPDISLDMLFVGDEPPHRLVSRLLLASIVHEVELSLQEEAHRPDPLRSLMVIPAMRGIGVYIISIILSIFRIEGLDTHAAPLHEDISYVAQANLCVSSIKELWSVTHGDADIASKLVIGVYVGGAVGIFIDSSPVHSFWIDIVLAIFVSLCRDPEASLKICFHHTCPVCECKLLFTAVSLDLYTAL